MKFLIALVAIAGCASAAVLPGYKAPVYQHPVHGVHAVQPVHAVRNVVPVAHHVAPVAHHAAPVAHHVGAEAAAPVVRSVSDIHPDGQYSWEYETGNGIVAKESGLAAHSVQGSYQYVSPDGTPIALTYVADENGYQPVGPHLPVAPETPAHVLRALEWIAAHPQQEEHAARYVHPVIPVTNKPAYTPFQYKKY